MRFGRKIVVKIMVLALLIELLSGMGNIEITKAATQVPKTFRFENGIWQDEFSLENNQAAVYTFKPDETAVYGIYASRAGGYEEGTDWELCFFVEGIAGAATGTSDDVVTETVLEKGKTYKIIVSGNKYDTNTALKAAGQIKMKKMNNRIQKLSSGKTIKFTQSKDGKLSDSQFFAEFDAATLTNKWYFKFIPQKTGYYRFYNTTTNSAWLAYNVYDYNGKKAKQYGMDELEPIKLKKGKIYYFSLDIYTNVKVKLKAEYIATTRTLELDTNTGKDSYRVEYVTKSGKKIGILRNNMSIVQPRELEGYKFLGWYTKKKGGKRIKSNSKLSKKIKVLYAHWKKK